MNSYVLIIIADILLTITFLIQKKYQLKVGVAVKSSLVYTILLSLFSAIIFLMISSCRSLF
jgi:hypothetical protein